MMKFLITTSQDAAEQLKQVGFQCISNAGERWVFLNNENLKFSNIKDVISTNKMFF